VTRRGREAALRIQLLFEEFTRAELTDGLSLLGAANGEDVTAFLLRRLAPATDQSQRRLPIHGGAMLSLRDAEPEKYNLIHDFEMRIRSGSLLPTLDSCRAFGKNISKDFQAGKSRKECIPRLVTVLSAMNVDDLRAAISRAPSYADRDSVEPYRRLATHIMSGGGTSR